ISPVASPSFPTMAFQFHIQYIVEASPFITALVPEMVFLATASGLPPHFFTFPRANAPGSKWEEEGARRGLSPAVRPGAESMTLLCRIWRSQGNRAGHRARSHHLSIFW